MSFSMSQLNFVALTHGKDRTMSLKQQKVQLVTGNITGVDQVSLHGRILTQTTGAMFLRPAL